MGEGRSSTDPAERIPARFTYRTCVPFVHVHSGDQLIAYYQRTVNAPIGTLVCLAGQFLYRLGGHVSISAAAMTEDAAERKIRRLIREMAQVDVPA